MRWLVLLWPLAFVLAYALGLQRYLSLHALAEHQQWLQGVAAAQPFAAAAWFIGLYVVVVAISLPGAEVLTIAGGLLFGTWAGAGYSVVGATTGAVVLFVAARSVLGAWLRRRAAQFMTRLQTGLERDGFRYLLALRLMPVVPFWLVNLAPALAGMRLQPFVLATLLGIIPATVVFASVGAGIGTVLQAGGRPDLAVVLRPGVLLPLGGLAALSLLPVAWRKWRERRR